MSHKMGLVGLGVGLLAGGGLAYSAIPGEDGLIHGCYENTTGALRVIDSDQGGVCRGGETALDWNQTGPAGPAGPAGPQGAAGPGVPEGSLPLQVTEMPNGLDSSVRKLAPKLRTKLAGPEFGLVLSSPRDRARRTAELADFPEAEVDDDLVEWSYGDYEGITTAEIREQVPGWTIWTHPTPGGESAAEVTARLDRVVARCKQALDSEQHHAMLGMASIAQGLSVDAAAPLVQQQLSRALGLHPKWSAVELLLPDGRSIGRVARAGVPQELGLDDATRGRVLSLQHAMISDLVSPPGGLGHYTFVAVPVDPLGQPGIAVAAIEHRVWPWVRSGAVKPQIGLVVPLRQVAEAHKALEERRVTGKVILVTDACAR